MIAREFRAGQQIRTVSANLPVTMKQFAVVQRRHVVKRFHRHRLALDGDDAAGGNLGTLAGDAVFAAVDGKCMIAECPRHLIFGVVKTGVLPGDPAVRHAVGIERQHQRQGAARMHGFLSGFHSDLIHVPTG